MYLFVGGKRSKLSNKSLTNSVIARKYSVISKIISAAPAVFLQKHWPVVEPNCRALWGPYLFIIQTRRQLITLPPAVLDSSSYCKKKTQPYAWDGSVLWNKTHRFDSRNSPQTPIPLFVFSSASIKSLNCAKCVNVLVQILHTRIRHSLQKQSRRAESPARSYCKDVSGFGETEKCLPIAIFFCFSTSMNFCSFSRRVSITTGFIKGI